MKAAVTALLVSTVLALPAFAQTMSTTPSGQPSANTPAAPSSATTPGAPASSANRPTTSQASTGGTGSMFVTASGTLWPVDRLEDVEVFNDTNEKIGTIEDVLVDDQGRVGGVVVSVGGFLGMGERHVAVSFNSLRWQMNDDANRGTTGASNTQAAAKAAPQRAILSGVTKDQLKNAPEYKDKD